MPSLEEKRHVYAQDTPTKRECLSAHMGILGNRPMGDAAVTFSEHHVVTDATGVASA